MSRRNPRRGAVLRQRFGHLAAPPAPQRLRPDQLRDLSLCHNVNLDAIASGQAEPSMLWDFAGAVFMWWKAARLLGLGQAETDTQLEVATRLVERFGRTGRVLFDGPDLQLARDGVVVMDLLAAQVDMRIATLAAEWSEREINRTATAVQQLKAQAGELHPMEQAA